MDEIINQYFNNEVITIDVFRGMILDIFKELGLSLKLSGTKFLFISIILVLCERREVDNRLYELVSERYNEPVRNVIKAISYAISTCFNKGGNEDLKRKIFGYCYSERTGSISNYNFIYNISTYILYSTKAKEKRL
jgi:hypothetical protein